MQEYLPYQGEVDLGYLQTFVQKVEGVLKLARMNLVKKELTLEYRWNMYMEIRPYSKIESMYHDFQTLEDIHEISWYDDFYLEKGETMDLDNDFIERATGRFSLDAEQIDALKEEVLEYASKNGFGAFENDW
jgi:hypothetical protein